MKLEAGKFYRTAGGRKVGPMRQSDDTVLPLFIDNNTRSIATDTILQIWNDDGTVYMMMTNVEKSDIIISEWGGTVQTIKHVPAQTLNGLSMYHSAGTRFACVGLDHHTYDANELRQHAAKLIELADIIDEAT